MSNREVFAASRRQRKVEWAKVAGKWTRREELYAGQLIKNFINGNLNDCQEGCTLRAYLARKLECAPMRISKKFSGQNLGKLTYTSNRNAAGNNSSTAAAGASSSPLVQPQPQVGQPAAGFVFNSSSFPDGAQQYGFPTQQANYNPSFGSFPQQMFPFQQPQQPLQQQGFMFQPQAQQFPMQQQQLQQQQQQQQQFHPQYSLPPKVPPTAASSSSSSSYHQQSFNRSPHISMDSNSSQSMHVQHALMSSVIMSPSNLMGSSTGAAGINSNGLAASLLHPTADGQISNNSPSDGVEDDTASDRDTFLRIADNLITPRESMSMFSTRSSLLSLRSSEGGMGLRFSENVDFFPDAAGADEEVPVNGNARATIDQENDAWSKWGVDPRTLRDDDAPAAAGTTKASSSQSAQQQLYTQTQANTRANRASSSGLSYRSGISHNSLRSSNFSNFSGQLGVGHTLSTLSMNSRMSTLSAAGAGGGGGIGAQSSVESFDHYMAGNHSFHIMERDSCQVQDRDYSIISTGDFDPNDPALLLPPEEADVTLGDLGGRGGDEDDDMETNPINYDSDDSEASELNLA